MRREHGTERDDAALLEAGRILFAGQSKFIGSSNQATVIPAGDVPEVAFAGRSNVGKSSLINALTSRTALARVSRTPGRTRELLFFELIGRLILVDMPGYGYANAPKKLARDWQTLVLSYLRGRSNLRAVLLLLDVRREPTATDHAAMAFLDQAAVAFRIVLSKADTLRPEDLSAQIAAAVELTKMHPAAHPEVSAISSRSGMGLARLRADLAELAA